VWYGVPNIASDERKVLLPDERRKVLIMQPPLVTEDPAQAREQLATAPPFPTATIGRLPPIIVAAALQTRKSRIDQEAGA
jgi:hypothetical protein